MTKKKPKERPRLNGPECNRETWLWKAAEILRPWFDEAGSPIPEHIRVSVGRTYSKKATGECNFTTVSADAAREIFISPKVDEPLQVLEVLIHELCHAALEEGVGHGPPFRKLATSLGLCGPMTATDLSPELKERLRKEVLPQLGEYPHAAMDLDKIGGRKKQSTRMIKCECLDCGYVCRASRKWIVEAGPPICPTDQRPMRAATV